MEPTDNFLLYRSIDTGRKTTRGAFAFGKDVSGTLTVTLLGPDHIQGHIEGFDRSGADYARRRSIMSISLDLREGGTDDHV